MPILNVTLSQGKMRVADILLSIKKQPLSNDCRRNKQMKRIFGVILLSLISTGVSAALITASPSVSGYLESSAAEPGVATVIALGIAGLVVARRRLRS